VNTASPHVSLTTPIGRGAVATIAIVGEGARKSCDHFFEPASGRPLAAAKTGGVYFGVWRGENYFEELVISLPTAERVEVHCHGGIAAAEVILQHLESVGCKRTDWHEQLHCWANDLIAQQAWVALTEATTIATTAVLLDQYRGALRNAISQIILQLEANEKANAAKLLTTLLATYSIGEHLTQPWRVAIVGRPNVGKSSLINVLLGYERAIVFDQPGTTRDVVTAMTAANGWPIELADTAGIREQTADTVESAGVELAQRALASADLTLLVIDQTVAEVEWEREVSQRTGVLVVRNKSDLTPTKTGLKSGVSMSAKNGEGLDELLEAIANRLVPQTPQPGDAILFHPAQKASIEATIAELSMGNAAAALQSLAAFGSSET